MDGVYNRILGEIRDQPSNTRKYALRALSWVGYATRTLSMKELLVAISVEPNQYQLDDSDKITFEDLLDYCRGLVIADGQAVRLVHFSARNFLDRHEAIPEDANETYRAIVCSTYLSFDALKGHPYMSLGRRFLFLDYAANNLKFHLSNVERRHYPETTSAVMKLLEGREHRGIYCAWDRKIGLWLDIPRLNLASAIGYEGAVETLLKEDDVGINAIDPLTRLTPLSWAVLMGHDEVAKRVLGDGRVDWRWDGSVPLFIAVCNAKIGIVQSLLEKGAEVNCTYNEVRYSASEGHSFIGAD